MLAEPKQVSDRPRTADDHGRRHHPLHPVHRDVALEHGCADQREQQQTDDQNAGNGPGRLRFLVGQAEGHQRDQRREHDQRPLRGQTAVVGFPVQQRTDQRRHGVADPGDRPLRAVDVVTDATRTVPVQAEVRDFAGAEDDHQRVAEFVEEGIEPFEPDPDGNEDQAQRAEQVAVFDQQQAQHPGEQHFQRHHRRQRQLPHAQNPAVARLVVRVGFRPGAGCLFPGTASPANCASRALSISRASLGGQPGIFSVCGRGLRAVGPVHASRCVNLRLAFATVFGALRCSVGAICVWGGVGVLFR